MLINRYSKCSKNEVDISLCKKKDFPKKYAESHAYSKEITRVHQMINISLESYQLIMYICM